MMSEALDELKIKYEQDGDKIKLRKKEPEESVIRTYRILKKLDDKIEYYAEKYNRDKREIYEIALLRFFEEIED